MTLTKHISYLKEDLYMAIVLLDVFKALKVKSQDCWKLLNSHPLVSLLNNYLSTNWECQADRDCT